MIDPCPDKSLDYMYMCVLKNIVELLIISLFYFLKYLINEEYLM